LFFAVLIALGSAPLYGAAPARFQAVVRDSAGVPQIGAEVQLLRPDLSGHRQRLHRRRWPLYHPLVLPGRYAVKAMGAWFLPSLRENVRVRANTVVNLTLNSLYEAMQWLPAEPRAGNAQKDDWAWTLRSAANRPLLRWLEDGPLVVVSDGSGRAPKLKARLMATGQEGTFGESGERIRPRSKRRRPTAANCWRAWILPRHRCRHGIDAGLPPGSGLCRLGAIGGRVAIHPEMTAAAPRDWTRPLSAVGRRSIWATSSRPRQVPRRCWRGFGSALPTPWPRRCPLPQWAGAMATPRFATG
jgi:hypothetical protein